MWIGICDGNMQEGSCRFDANVSVRPAGETKLGTRCEIKNLNSFRFLQHAIEFEVRRQIEVIEEGGKVEQETRLYDAERDETRSMRTKEDAHDYRYFPDPDLLPLVLREEQIRKIETEMPELPDATRERFARQYALPAYDAGVLTASRAAAGYFEALVRAAGVDAKLCAYWQTGALSAALNEADLQVSESKLSPASLAGLLK